MWWQRHFRWEVDKVTVPRAVRQGGRRGGQKLPWSLPARTPGGDRGPRPGPEAPSSGRPPRCSYLPLAVIVLRPEVSEALGWGTPRKRGAVPSPRESGAQAQRPGSPERERRCRGRGPEQHTASFASRLGRDTPRARAAGTEGAGAGDVGTGALHCPAGPEEDALSPLGSPYAAWSVGGDPRGLSGPCPGGFAGRVEPLDSLRILRGAGACKAGPGPPASRSQWLGIIVCAEQGRPTGVCHLRKAGSFASEG